MGTGFCLGFFFGRARVNGNVLELDSDGYTALCLY